MGSIRVLIADDHRLFAEALEVILAGDDRISVVGHASDGGEAVRLAESLHPDVVLMDISMPGMDGVEAAQAVPKTDAEGRIPKLHRPNPPAPVGPARPARGSR